jgi:hypothetical protein
MQRTVLPARFQRCWMDLQSQHVLAAPITVGIQAYGIRTLDRSPASRRERQVSSELLPSLHPVSWQRHLPQTCLHRRLLALD